MPMYGNESTAAPKLQFEMDKDAEERFVKFVERMPVRSEGMVRLFDRGDYYSAHGVDALMVAQQVYKTPSILKYLGSGTQSSAASSSSHPRGLPSVTISTALTKAFLRECLTTKQMRIEIYEPEEGAAGRKNHARWIMAKAASPGNISQVEDLLFSHTDLEANAVSMALRIHVKDGGRTVGCAFVDVQEKLLGVAEYVDDENFGNTESLLIQLGVKECLLQSDDKKADHELVKLRTLVERCNVIVTERKAADFIPRSVDQDLNRLLTQSSSGMALPEFDLKHAMSAMSALLIYMNLLGDSYLHGLFHLHRHDLSQFMKLDASALKALNLMPNPLELGGSKNMSLYGLLDRCATSQGKRLLARWLKQPLVNLHEINRRQGIVEAFYDDSMGRQNLRESSILLKSMLDFHRVCKKFHRGQADLQDVVRVYDAVNKLPELARLLQHIDTPESANKDLLQEIYVDPVHGHIEEVQKYIEMVEDTVDLQATNNHEYVLQSKLSDDLQSYRDQITAVCDAMDEEHRRVGQDLGLDIDKKLHLEKHQVHRYSFRITKAEAALIRNKREYIDLATQKSGSIFTTTHLRHLSEQYFELFEKYERKQRQLVKEVVGIAATYIPVLEILDELIASIDVTLSFAHVSASAPIAYVRPKLTAKGTGDLVVTGARHPCLEVQDDVDFISNDHEMRKGTSEFAIVTGPNMGGKSTYIRQIGVIALMAQIGCFVPADRAELPIFDCILARVGAGDSQLKGVSTFMAEMLETATILRSATKDSLIIIDELGRGTSTYDGFGLAWAISEHIASKIRCLCLFATHFHELTTLSQSQPHVKNLHVKVRVQPKDAAGGTKENDITLLYKVQEGVCDQSFGIHVAELANFPESVVKLAKRKAEELEDFGDGAVEESVNKYSKQETDEGAVLLKTFLDEWQARVDQGGTGNEGAKMTEDEQIDELRRVAGEYKERFQGNAWVRGLLETF